MDGNLLKDRDYYYDYYRSEDRNLDLMSNSNNCYWMDEESPQYASPRHYSRFTHPFPTTTNLVPAFNACVPSGSITDDNRVHDLDQLSSLLRYTGQLQKDSNSLSSSFRTSSLTPNSVSRSSYSHSPVVNMEFNEDVLVMDGILLNELSGDCRSSRSSMFGSSSSSSASGGKHLSSGVYRQPHVHRTWKKPQQQQPSFLTLGKKKGRTPSPNDEVPRQLAESSAMWANLSRIYGVNPPVSDPIVETGNATPTTSCNGALEVVNTPTASGSSTESSTAHTVTSPSNSSLHVSTPPKSKPTRQQKLLGTLKLTDPFEVEDHDDTTTPEQHKIIAKMIAPFVFSSPEMKRTTGSSSTVSSKLSEIEEKIILQNKSVCGAAEASTSPRQLENGVVRIDHYALFEEEEKTTVSSKLSEIQEKLTVQNKSVCGAAEAFTSPRQLENGVVRIDYYALLDEEEKIKGKERVYRENVPAIRRRLPIFDSICPLYSLKETQKEMTSLVVNRMV